jgi:hypothetical protein
MPRLTKEELKAMVEKNPDVSIVDDGNPMGDKPEVEFKTMKQIVAEVGQKERMKQYDKEAGPILTIEHEPEPEFKSKTEERAWGLWVPTTGCVEAYYEPIRVYLNSGSYLPDFVLRMPDRTLWFVEVKGSWNAYASGRSSKKSLKEAAKMYWWLGRWFSLLPKKGGGWNLEEYT